MKVIGRKYGNRAAFAALFFALSMALTGCGSSGPAAAEEHASASEAAESVEVQASEDSEEAEAGSVPVIWYDDEALYLYEPLKEKCTKLTSLLDGSTDRMFDLASPQNLADLAVVSEDKSRVFFMKGIHTDLMGASCGDLYFRELLFPKAEEQFIAHEVSAYRLMSDGSVVWLDAGGVLWRCGTSELSKRKRLAAGVQRFHVSDDGSVLCYTTDSQKLFVLGVNESEACRAAEDVYEILWSSDDLKRIYYTNGNSDLFCVRDFYAAEIVDVDIAETVFFEETGSVYYMKEQKLSEGEDVPETEVIDQLKDALNESFREQLGNEEDYGEYVEAALQLAMEDKNYEIGYYDGTRHGILIGNVQSVDKDSAENCTRDRLIVRQGIRGDYRIDLLCGDKILDTGLNNADDLLAGIAIDRKLDNLYYSVKGTDSEDSLKSGAVYAKSFTEDGFAPAEKKFDGAPIFSAVDNGRAFCAYADGTTISAELWESGEKISERVTTYFWEGDTELMILRNIYQDDTYCSGEFLIREDDGSLRRIASNVKEAHTFEDGAFTFLSDYDEDREQGLLVYWDGEDGEPKLLSDHCIGTAKSEEEKK